MAESDKRSPVRQTYLPILPDESEQFVFPRFYWLETPVTVSTTVTTYAYTWFDASKYVPDGATALIVNAYTTKSGAGDSTLEVRMSARLNPVKILYCDNSTSHDSATNVILPLDQRDDRLAFQHRVTGVSFGTSLSFTLVGYYK